jgi:hypothetical protein
MVISEKQIIKLISIAWDYADKLKNLEYQSGLGQKIDIFLGEILEQQSEELKVIE